MSDKYQVIYEIPEEIYQEGAPVLVTGGTLLSQKETGDVLVRLQFQNLDPEKRVIRTVSVLIVAYDAEGRTLGDTSFTYTDMQVERGACFGSNYPVFLRDRNTAFFTVGVSAVLFADGTVWNNQAVEVMEAAEEEPVLKPHKGAVLGMSLAAGLMMLILAAVLFNQGFRRTTNQNAEEAHTLQAVELASIPDPEKPEPLSAEEGQSADDAEEETDAASEASLGQEVLDRKAYEEAAALLEQGEYLKAVTAFEALGEYENSAERALEAEYGYVTTHQDAEDENTYAFLKELRDLEYQDAAQLFETLYKWKLKLYANLSSGDTSHTYDSISKYETFYVHMCLSGGEPGATQKLKIRVEWPNGDKQSTTSDTLTAGEDYWINGYWPNPEAMADGNMTVSVYGEDGKRLNEMSFYYGE